MTPPYPASSSPIPSVTLDHIFLITPARPDTYVDHLRRAGFEPAACVEHLGQGTASISFDFANAYLELLYVTDDEALRSQLVARTRLWERSRSAETGVSPYGVCLRAVDCPSPPTDWPVPTWRYAAPFLPSGAAIPIADDTPDSRAPILFFNASLTPRRRPAWADPCAIAAVHIETSTLPLWHDALAPYAPFLSLALAQHHALTILVAAPSLSSPSPRDVIRVPGPPALTIRFGPAA